MKLGKQWADSRRKETLNESVSNGGKSTGHVSWITIDRAAASKTFYLFFFLISFRFEEIASSNGQMDAEDEEEDETEASESDGIVRSRRKKKPPREHVGVLFSW